VQPPILIVGITGWVWIGERPPSLTPIFEAFSSVTIHSISSYISRRMPSHRLPGYELWTPGVKRGWMEHDMHMQISRLNLFLYELGSFSWAISRSFRKGLGRKQWIQPPRDFQIKLVCVRRPRLALVHCRPNSANEANQWSKGYAHYGGDEYLPP
jgi:hypothetical protein